MEPVGDKAATGGLGRAGSLIVNSSCPVAASHRRTDGEPKTLVLALTIRFPFGEKATHARSGWRKEKLPRRATAPSGRGRPWGSALILAVGCGCPEAAAKASSNTKVAMRGGMALSSVASERADQA